MEDRGLKIAHDGDHLSRSSILDLRSSDFPWLLLLFVGSGCAALIYEIVWFQFLQLVVGSSAVSIGVLLGTFMGGMCLGSLGLPRFISSHRHPLRVYAALECGIGLCGLIVLYGMPVVSGLYATHVGPGLSGFLLRGLVAAISLLPPTILMGATLPAVARWVESDPRGISSLGILYAGNIVGAVFGCLLAGFYLLRVHDLATATWVAVFINLEVAVIALAVSFRAPHQPAVSAPAVNLFVPARGASTAYFATALSGMCALGAEVIWTRLLSLMLGGTVYTFSIILAVFLVGLGIGSSYGASLARRSPSPQRLLGICQLLLAAAVAWSAWQLSRSLPYWPINPSLSHSPWLDFQLDLLRCAWAILPAACLWGASFPLALAAVASPGQDSGRLVGQVYAANTVGAIVGATGFSIVMIRWAGTQHSQQLLMAFSAVAGGLVLIPLLLPRRDAPASMPIHLGRSLVGALALTAAAGIIGWIAWYIPAIPGELIAYGRFLPLQTDGVAILFQGEGMNSSVAVSELPGGIRSFHVSGKVEASNEAQDMRLQRMLGHLPALLHPKPRSVLVVGCGAGVTAGSFVVHPEVERIVICEIEPLIPEVVVKYFGKENHDVIGNPRVQVVYDDARHFILTTDETFDVITSDPIHPWVKGAATLYTAEYLELCKRHLNPGGIISQWVPLYESNPQAVKSELATILSVFPQGSIWGNDIKGEGYDVVLIGHVEPLEIDVDLIQERLRQFDHAPVARSLADVGFPQILDLLSTYAGQASDLEPWLKDAEINRDRNLRLQYLAGMGLNLYDEKHIYNEILSYREYPEKLFVASAKTHFELKRRLGMKAPSQ